MSREFERNALNVEIVRLGLFGDDDPMLSESAGRSLDSRGIARSRNGGAQGAEFRCTIDCGLALQPDNIVAQTKEYRVRAGIASSERITIQDGVVVQSNFYPNQVLRRNKVPLIHVEVIRTDNPPSGVGQMAAPLGAPAVGNAIARLTGVRLRHPPFTAERVKKGLG